MNPEHSIHHDSNTIYQKVRTFDSIFDIRDPEPLYLRKLNPEWLEYMFESINNKPGKHALNLCFEATEDLVEEWNIQKLEKSLRRELMSKQNSLRRKLHENFKLGRISLGIAIIILIVFMSISELTSYINLGVFQYAFKEGFLIIGWVALWRPVEILLYDWWPIFEDRRKIKRLLRGNIIITTTERHPHHIAEV